MRRKEKEERFDVSLESQRHDGKDGDMCSIMLHLFMVKWAIVVMLFVAKDAYLGTYRGMYVEKTNELLRVLWQSIRLQFCWGLSPGRPTKSMWRERPEEIRRSPGGESSSTCQMELRILKKIKRTSILF